MSDRSVWTLKKVRELLASVHARRPFCPKAFGCAEPLGPNEAKPPALPNWCYTLTDYGFAWSHSHNLKEFAKCLAWWLRRSSTYTPVGISYPSDLLTERADAISTLEAGRPRRPAP